jgi:acyl-CoA synthetase (AMP-forming)/AMP-acid ligase II
VHSTHPPAIEAAERYRREGFWLPAHTADEHHRMLCAGGDRTAVTDSDGSWTYQQLAAAVGAARSRLTAAGVSRGDAVLIVAPLRNAAVAGYLATVQLGAVAVLLDRRSGTAEARHACDAAHPLVSLAFRADADRLGVNIPVVDLDLVNCTADAAPPDARLLNPDLPAVVVFTSGTTGRPKGVLHTLNSLRFGTTNMVAALGFRPDDVFALSAPLASITGIIQLQSAITRHAAVLLQDRFVPSIALDDCVRHGVSIIGGTPVIAQTIFAEARRRGIGVGALRTIAVGGAAVPDSLLQAAADFGVESVRIFGSSEAPVSTAAMSSGGVLPDNDGAPLPGVDIGLGSDDELLVNGPHRCHGYLDPADNAAAFDADWVRTGDRARITDGRVTITGRLKDIAIRKGMKISLAEIDSAATPLGECVAFTVPDDDTGERVALAVRTELSYPAMVAALEAAGLARWKLPEQIVVWDGYFPRTASGKVIRDQLRDTARHRSTGYAPRLAGD